MRRRNPGRTRHKLAAMLSKALGTYVDPGELQEAQGWWRTNPGSEALRWEASGGIGSWSTMTDCVRHGFDIERGDMSKPTTLGYAYPIAVNARAPKKMHP